jgi:transcriptional regulator with XRE-family HTH domain
MALMKTPIKHPGWPRVIKALGRAGVTQTEIEKRTGISQNFLSDLLHRKSESLKFESGVMLYAMYLQVIRKEEIRVVPITH